MTGNMEVIPGPADPAPCGAGSGGGEHRLKACATRRARLIPKLRERPCEKRQVRRSEERTQNHAAIGDEGHEEAQHRAHDNGRDLVVLEVHPDEDEALDRQHRGGHYRERRLPVKGGGDDQADRADEFEDAEGHPSFPRQRTEGLDILAYLVEREDLHDTRGCVEERGEDLQDPQQDVHRAPPPGFRAGARRSR